MDNFYKNQKNLSKNEGILGANETQIETTKEQGRSMVEMLGVLAIVGVLSVGAISGYRYAMNKYRANQTVNELNLLSHQVAIAMMSKNGMTGTLKLGEPYDTNKKLTSAGYDIAFGCGESDDETPCQNQNKFHFEVNGVSEGVCKELVQMSEHMQFIKDRPTNCEATNLSFVFELPEAIGGDAAGDGAFVFDDSGLPQTAPSLTCENGGVLRYGVCSCDNNYFGTTCSQYCSGLQVWDGTNCVAACPSGTHYESSIKECVSGCTENANCEADEYCYLREGYSCSNEFGSGSGQKYGSCRKVQGDSMKVGEYIVSTRGMTWWSAKRFCERAGNKNRVSASTLGCTLAVFGNCLSTVYTPFHNAGINDGVWLDDLYDDGSCYAYYVGFLENRVYYKDRDGYNRAICQ